MALQPVMDERESRNFREWARSLKRRSVTRPSALARLPNRVRISVEIEIIRTDQSWNHLKPALLKSHRKGHVPERPLSGISDCLLRVCDWSARESARWEGVVEVKMHASCLPLLILRKRASSCPRSRGRPPDCYYCMMTPRGRRMPASHNISNWCYCA